MGQLSRLLTLKPTVPTNRQKAHVFPAKFRNPIAQKRSVSTSNVSVSLPSLVAFRHNNSHGSRLICKLTGSDTASQLELGKSDKGRKPEKRVNGIFWIILLNLGIFVADLCQIPTIKTLYLHHYSPAWYQFVTAAFCHANWNHLSSNLFFLYIFGKLVEEEEGSLAVWLSYILTGVGANLVSWSVLPRNAISVGASGAVFGLFAISVLLKISWDWRKIFEVLILGQFVVEKLIEATQASTGFIGTYALQKVNHTAHLSGALVGALLIWLLSRIRSHSSRQEDCHKKPDKPRL